MIHLSQSNSYTVCTGLVTQCNAPPNSHPSDFCSGWQSNPDKKEGLELNVGGIPSHNFNSLFDNTTIRLNKIDSDLKQFAHETELSFIKEELALTRLQNDLTQIKYDLLLDTNNKLMVENKEIATKLESYICNICLSKPKDCILEPCGHFVSCMSCIRLLPNSKCPVCRTMCNYYTRIYNT